MRCRVPAVSRARSALRPRRAGRTGTGSCPRTRPPGNAAPHRAEARTQMRPVFRSSPRWPRALSSVPPSSPEGQPVPCPGCGCRGPDPALPAGGAPTGAAGPRGPGRHRPCAPLLLRSGPWTVLSGPKASRTTGKRESVTPSKDSLFQREGGPARELPAPTQAVQVGAPVHGRLPSHARRHHPFSLECLTHAGGNGPGRWPSLLTTTGRAGCGAPQASIGTPTLPPPIALRWPPRPHPSFRGGSGPPSAFFPIHIRPRPAGRAGRTPPTRPP